MTEMSLEKFTAELGSKAPVPGGGGAAALTGALAASLASMTAALTVGKKKYEAVGSDMERIKERAEALRKELLSLIEEDAKGFAKVGEAYSVKPSNKEEEAKKETLLEVGLYEAAMPPLNMMRLASKVMELHEELSRKCSRLVVSDAGTGIVLADAAVKTAALNVFVNTKLMKDREKAAALNKEALSILEKNNKIADRVYEEVKTGFLKGN